MGRREERHGVSEERVVRGEDQWAPPRSQKSEPQSHRGQASKKGQGYLHPRPRNRANDGVDLSRERGDSTVSNMRPTRPQKLFPAQIMTTNQELSQISMAERLL